MPRTLSSLPGDLPIMDDFRQVLTIERVWRFIHRIRESSQVEATPHSAVLSSLFPRRDLQGLCVLLCMISGFASAFPPSGVGLLNVRPQSAAVPPPFCARRAEAALIFIIMQGYYTAIIIDTKDFTTFCQQKRGIFC